MQKFTFHRDDLVPEEISTQELLDNWNPNKEALKYHPGEKVRNKHKLDIVMVVHSLVRTNNKLVGIKCYWWE